MLAPPPDAGYIAGRKRAQSARTFFSRSGLMVEDLAELTAAVRTRLTDLGFELADLRKGGSASRALLQVRIDRPDASPGHGITVDDCARVSRALESWLDQ